MKSVPLQRVSGHLGVCCDKAPAGAQQASHHLASPVQLILLLALTWFSGPGVTAWPLPEHSFRARGKKTHRKPPHNVPLYNCSVVPFSLR